MVKMSQSPLFAPTLVVAPAGSALPTTGVEYMNGRLDRVCVCVCVCVCVGVGGGEGWVHTVVSVDVAFIIDHLPVPASGASNTPSCVP